MKQFIYMVIIIVSYMVIDGNIGYFKYDGSARDSEQSKPINYYVGQ